MWIYAGQEITSASWLADNVHFGHASDFLPVCLLIFSYLDKAALTRDMILETYYRSLTQVETSGVGGLSTTNARSGGEDRVGC